ncbi:MAG: CDP-alcohol phosphatidyltransferase family protein [Bacteroidota bacterium]
MSNGEKTVSTSNIDGKAVEVTNRWFTWSNMISFSRLFVAFPIIYLYHINGQQADLTVILLVIYGVISDYLDGIVARATGSVSELGKMLDPIADKLAALVLFSYVVWIGRIPLWFFLFGIGRDLLIISGSMWIRSRRGKVPMAVMSGKISVNIMALYWMIAFFAPFATVVLDWLLWTSIVAMVYSFGEYMYRFVQIERGAQFN